jgi:5'-nucleotidase
VPMAVARYGEDFEKRIDPRGRSYYWATNEPPAPPGEEDTDLTALRKGFMTLTPLNYNMTHAAKLAEMQRWEMGLGE